MFIQYEEVFDSGDDLIAEMEKVIEETMEAVAEELEWEIKRLAAHTLEETLTTYIEDLRVDVHGTEIQISLIGELSGAVEGGSEPFDLKPGFMGGGLSKVIPLTGAGPDGNRVGLRFRTAPFSKRQPSKPWHHPGIKPRGLVSKAYEKVESADIDRIFEEKFSARMSV